ncbi:MAG: hypothetical protein ACPIOQ_06310, partial [Promethearchaeia archaeon]
GLESMLVSCPEYTEIGIWAAPEHRAMKEGQKGHGRRRRRCCFTYDVHKGEQMSLKSRCCALFGPLLPGHSFTAALINPADLMVP